MIKIIFEILKNLSGPFSSWWSKKQNRADIDRIRKRDEWRRERDRLRKEYENAVGEEAREKTFKAWFDHINSPID